MVVTVFAESFLCMSKPSFPCSAVYHRWLTPEDSLIPLLNGVWWAGGTKKGLRLFLAILPCQGVRVPGSSLRSL